jgi:serine/threonine-protein kinase
MMDGTRQVGRYRVREVIAYGGMGIVLLGEDPLDGSLVAIKQVHAHRLAEPGITARFLREGEIAERLHHPNVVAVLDVGTSEGRPYLAMEYVGGGTLADELGRNGPASVDRTLEVAGQVCAALAYAHQAGVVHRDVTPRNLLLTSDGTVKVADFGIARLRDATQLTVTGSVLGTVRYLAPEQAAGRSATPATDLYALGVVLYELLTGRTPYEADSPAALVLLQQTESPTPLSQLRPDVPAPVAAAITSCLARDPAGRPASAAALAWQLGLGEPGSTRVVSPPQAGEATEPLWVRPPRPASSPRPRGAPRHWRRTAVLATAGLAAAGLLVLAGLRLGGGSAASPPPSSNPVVQPAPTDPDADVQARELAQWLRSETR